MSYEIEDKECDKCKEMKKFWELTWHKHSFLCIRCCHDLRENMFKKDLFKKISLTFLLLFVILTLVITFCPR